MSRPPNCAWCEKHEWPRVAHPSGCGHLLCAACSRGECPVCVSANRDAVLRGEKWDEV